MKKKFPNYTSIIPERQICNFTERFPNHELITMSTTTVSFLQDILFLCKCKSFFIHGVIYRMKYQPNVGPIN
jgi:hypothetical protein